MSKPTFEEIILQEIRENRNEIRELQKQMSFVKSVTLIVSAVVGFFSAEIKKKLGL